MLYCWYTWEKEFILILAKYPLVLISPPYGVWLPIRGPQINDNCDGYQLGCSRELALSNVSSVVVKCSIW